LPSPKYVNDFKIQKSNIEEENFSIVNIVNNNFDNEVEFLQKKDLSLKENGKKTSYNENKKKVNMKEAIVYMSSQLNYLIFGNFNLLAEGLKNIFQYLIRSAYKIRKGRKYKRQTLTPQSNKYRRSRTVK